jgi:integrase
MRGQGRVYLRAKSAYWVAFMHAGKEMRESAHTSDKREAEKYLQRRLDERGADRRGVEVFATQEMKRVTVHELLENVKNDLGGKGSAQTLSTIRTADEGIKDAETGMRYDGFGHYKALSLTSQYIKDYIARRLAQDYKPATINRVTGMLRHAFKLAVREGKISRAPYFKQLSEKDNVRQGFCSAAEFERIKANLSDTLADFAEFGFRTGWRRGEIAGLDWSNVQDGDRMIRLRPDQTKNGIGRSVPVTGKLVDVIRRRREARAFESSGTTQLSNLVFHRRGREVFEFRKAWHTACKKAGKPELLFHDLRRSAVTALINSGTPQFICQAISGHETASMLKRYAIRVESEQVNAMERVEQWHAGQTAQQPASNVRTMAAK